MSANDKSIRLESRRGFWEDEMQFKLNRKIKRLRRWLNQNQTGEDIPQCQACNKLGHEDCSE